MIRPWLYALAVVLALSAAAGVGYQWGWTRGWRAGYDEAAREYKAVLAEAERKVDEARDALRAQVDKITAATRAALAAAEDAHARTLAQIRSDGAAEVAKVRAVARADRRAFDASLTRLLNEQARVRETAPAAGPAAGRTDGADRPAAANPAGSAGGTSERALAEWIAGAMRAHARCRAVATGLQQYARACAARSVTP